MKQLCLSFAVLLILVLIYWRSMQRATRATRWVIYVVFAVSWALWVYTANHPGMTTPLVWIQNTLSVFDLIK